MVSNWRILGLALELSVLYCLHAIAQITLTDWVFSSHFLDTFKSCALKIFAAMIGMITYRQCFSPQMCSAEIYTEIYTESAGAEVSGACLPSQAAS